MSNMQDTPIPIAVVGIGCRLPGGANTPDRLWKMLAEGRDSWTDSEDRFKWKSFWHPDAESQGTYNHRGGHLLDQDIAAFDNGFFDIPGFECEAIDPQQRIQAEVAYEALENAGIPMERVRGTNTAVYVAIFSQDYAQMQWKDLDDIPKYCMTGIGPAIIANRISYLFDLKGPSVSVDTGCSGGLVAIHQACQSLRTGETSMALAGGVNLLLSPDIMIPMSLMHILNPDGRCYSFDTRGSGYGRGEGAAMVVLKRLDDAIRDGDQIRAVIRNSGVNHDGKTTGITLPSRISQESLIRTVYGQVALDPKDTPYIEAHGTGTAVGDDEEISAIRAVFEESQADPEEDPLYVGTIKPNIGHLESVSGLAGFIKAVLMIERGKIPPNVNLKVLKKILNLDTSRVQIPTCLGEWPEGKLRRISVNSFGYGGTNGHAIVEAFNAEKPFSNGVNGHHVGCNGNGVRHSIVNGVRPNGILTNGAVAINTPQVLSITAKNERSLKEVVANVREWVTAQLDGEPGSSDQETFLNLAHTLSGRRSLMQWRHCFTATSLEDIASSLSEIGNLKPNRSSANDRVVFVFTGQGAQWFGMGRELMKIQSPYSDSIRRADKILSELGAPWSLVEELSKDEQHSRVAESEIAQPATTAVQIALVDLLGHLKVKPYAVLGHSSGEIGAAYAAGAMDRDTALKVAYHRGRLNVHEVVFRKGAMLAVGLGAKEASAYTSRLTSGCAVVACSNSPSSSTISGDEDAILELKTILDAESVFARRLKVDTAYHSHHVRAVAYEYFTALRGLKTGSPKGVKFFSSVTAEQRTEDFGREYWVDNLISRVRFREALEALCSDISASAQSTLISLTPAFVELGPHNALAGPIRQTMMGSCSVSGFSSFSALSRNQNALSTFFDLVARLFERGCSVDLSSANLLIDSTRPRRVLHDLPPYAWDHTNKYWHESRLSKAHRFRPHPYHDLLGMRVVSSTALEPVWRHVISVTSLPWLREHTIDGMPVFPGAAYMTMAIEAMRQLALERPDSPEVSKYVLKDVSFISALVIPDSPKESVEVQMTVRSAANSHEKAASEWKEFRVTSVSSDGANVVEHCRGLIMIELTASASDVSDATREEAFVVAERMRHLETLRGTCAEEVDCPSLYSDLTSKGNYYGPNFACVKKLQLDGDVNAFGTVVVPDVADCMPSKFMQPHVIHPTTLDSLLHASFPLFGKKRTGQSVMASGIGELTVSSNIGNAAHTMFMATTTLQRAGLRSAAADISVFQTDERGEAECVMHITEAEFFATGSTKDEEAENGRDVSYHMKWDIDSEHITPSLFKSDDLLAEVEQEKKLHRLNQAAAVYLNSCLEKLGHRDPASFSGHYRHFFNWMKKFQYSAANHELIGNLTESEQRSLLGSLRDLGLEGELVWRVCPRLPEIVTGQINPLTVMTEDDMLYRLYSDDASTRCYGHISCYLQHATFKNPNMTMLELGGGTGAATLPVLQSLGSNGVLPINRYDFTDVSAAYFERTGDRLQKWKNYLEFKLLDVRADFVQQGFEEGSYDIIIASNVVHVATYIKSTLSQIRRLLKPGGRLVMLEITRVLPFYNTCVGMLEGWWEGINDGRIDSPLLSRDQWNDALLGAGFSGVEIAAKDYEGAAHRSAVLISKAVAKEDGPRETIPANVLMSPTWAAKDRPEFVINLNTALWEAALPTSTRPLISQTEFSPDALHIVLDDGANPILKADSPELFDVVKKLLVHSTRILWVTVQEDLSAVRNPEKGMIHGFARVARGENPQLRLVTLDIQDAAVGSKCASIIQKIKDVALTSFYGPEAMRSSEFEYAYQDGQLCVPRLVPDAKLNRLVRQTGGDVQIQSQPFHQPARPLKLQVPQSGLLEDLHFVDDDAPQGLLSDDEIEVQVEACGINSVDVAIASGQVKKPLPMAGEYSGTVAGVPSALRNQFKVGDRVCGFGATAYASRIKANAVTVCRIPESMSFATAAAVSIAFSTAYLGLVDIARLHKGQTVLIHAASGGVDQAALTIAKHIGSEIFATASSESGRRLLIDQFGIPEDHVFSSNTGVFKKGVLRLTGGKGVDVILNSLSGQLLQDSWASIASFGTFVELGKTDVQSKTAVLGMAPFDRHVTFASVDMSLMCLQQPEKAGRILKLVMSMFGDGLYAPMNPITVMPITEIEEAFRLLKTGKTVGKVVLEANSTANVKAVSKPSPEEGMRLKANATYMIAGGVGGLGVEIALYMVTRGARHIVLLSRRGLQGIKLQELQDRFRKLGAEVVVFATDITDPSKVQQMFQTCAQTLPPIAGIIQASMVLKDRVMGQMTLEEWKAATNPKVAGTQNLVKAMEGRPLDFFLMLSSGASIIGNLSQANYAAGNAYLDALATSNATSRSSPFVALNLGPITDAGAMAESDRLKQILMRQGYVLVKVKELLAMLDYSLSDEAMGSGRRQFIIGFDYRSLNGSDNQVSLANPMFSHLLQTTDNSETKQQDGEAVQSIEDAIAAATTIEQMGNIVAEVIARKISTLVAVAFEEIDLQRGVIEFGLDSLVVIELKNWISRKFQATLQASEISDAQHIIALAMTVASRSALVAKSLSSDTQPESNGVNGTEDQKAERNGPKVNGFGAPAKSEPALPKQPLPALDDTLNQYRDTIRGVLTKKEYAKMVTFVEEFRHTGGVGRTLQRRLEQLANNPQIENWQSELYARHGHLRDRTALVPYWNFFFTHLPGSYLHSAAERAAVISAAAFQFKQQLDAGDLKQELVNDQPVSMDLYSWLFNATREPRLDEDKVIRYPGNDYVVAFRRGNLYKIPLRQDDGPVSYAVLKRAFQAILDADQPTSWLGVLTADERNSWAKMRHNLASTSLDNKRWLETVEAAAFVVYLDEARPQTAEERGQQFLHANGFNRWNDKTVQFAVTDNGFSATIGEHSMIDGVVIRRLHDFVTAAIRDKRPDTMMNDYEPSSPIVEEYAFRTTSVLEKQIEKVRVQVRDAASNYELAAFGVDNATDEFFRAHKCHPRSAIQMAVQLAVRRHFGYSPAAFEPVSLSHFLKGRVELVQVLVPDVAEFCGAAANESNLNPATHTELRKHFLQAVKAHTNSVMRASRGNGIDRHMLCLQWSLQDGEEVPALFSSPLYKKTRPRLVGTNTLPLGALECGAFRADPDSFWIHFESEKESLRFSVWGPRGETEAFRKLVEKSVEDVRKILEA